MALLWVEGFEKFGTAGSSVSPATNEFWNIIAQKYGGTYADRYSVQTGRGGSGKCLRSLGTAEYLVTPDLNPTGDTLITGFAVKFRDFDNDNWIVDFRHPTGDGATVGYNQLTLKTNTSSGNNISVYRGGTLLASSSGLALEVDTWYYMEMKIKCNETIGTANVSVDGIPVISFSGDTQHRSISDRYSRVMFHCDKTEHMFYDDWYVCDGSGSKNNDFLGDCVVATIDVTSDVSGNWTPSTGADMYAVIDEATQGADYISDETSGNQALFETSNLTGNAAVGTVRGVMITCESQQFDNSKKYAKLITQNGSGGSIQDTGNFAPGNEVNPFANTHVMELNPDGDDWSTSFVNDLRIGVEVS